MRLDHTLENLVDTVGDEYLVPPRSGVRPCIRMASGLRNTTHQRPAACTLAWSTATVAWYAQPELRLGWLGGSRVPSTMNCYLPVYKWLHSSASSCVAMTARRGGMADYRANKQVHEEMENAGAKEEISKHHKSHVGVGFC